MQHLRFQRWAGAFALWSLFGSAYAQAPKSPAKPKPEKAQDEGARAAEWLKKSFGGQPLTEAAEMLVAIAKGSEMGMGDGWFHPGQSRYGWKWLAQKHGISPSGTIPRAKFQGPEAVFKRLDRNKDGELAANDFDWSDRSPFAQQSWMVNRWFRRANKAGDGRLTRDEWDRFFEQAADGKEYLTTEDLRDALTSQPKTTTPDMPNPEVLVRGLFRGEIGSMHEGPKVDDPAPDFSLKTRDGRETIRLSDHFGKKPIVVVFGNFTCGPFRSMYPRVDDLAQRYKSAALFLGVYVREAHPTDGWRMGSNDDVGVSIAQPHDYAERASVANRCSLQLKMGIPLLVDEMDDRVGHAYSGMPARLYIIDRQGKIAYKSGRGPFGFKADEMEQSLLMLMLDEHKLAGTAPVVPAKRGTGKP
jgi:thiol-disulfide isomerase/thioredoxin